FGPPAVYSLALPESLRQAWTIGADTTLSVSLAATNTKPGPRAEEKEKKEEEEKPADEKAKAGAKKAAPKKAPPKKPAEPKKPKEKPDETPVDLTIEVVDEAGHTARLPLSRYGCARHPLEANVYRRRGRDKQRFTNNYELVPQSFLLPLADFVQSSPEFNPGTLATVRLLFDKTVAGTIIVEHVGLSAPR